MKGQRDNKKAVWISEETHTELAVMAARSKVTIKKFLEELVEAERKKRESNEK